AAVDGFGRHPEIVVVGEGALKPARDLPGRPVPRQPLSHQIAQPLIARQQAGRGPTCPLPGTPFSGRRPIGRTSTVTVDLTTYRRWRTPQQSGNLPHWPPRGQSSRNRLTLLEGQLTGRALAGRRSDAATGLQYVPHRISRNSKRARDLGYAFAALPSGPDLSLLLITQARSSSHATPPFPNIESEVLR